MTDQHLGKYQLIAQLGQGGMADVFLAVFEGPAGLGINKLVVLKRLKPGLSAEPEQVDMLVEEARIAMRLNHPNIVSIHEIGEAGGQYFIAMEFLDGQPLNVVRRRAEAVGRSLPLSMQLRILVDVLAGLHHAHELGDYDGSPLGIVHRDVSPHNVFVTYDGHAKVVDFGIAKATTRSSNTADGIVKGKVAYMSPEQARGDAIDRRSDVFAVGVMLWEAVTGRRLWGDLTDVGILSKLASGEIPRLPGDPPVPASIARMCARALAADRKDRYTNAAEFHDDLERYLRAAGGDERRFVAATMNELFSARRKQFRALVERHLKALASGDAQTVDVLTFEAETATSQREKREITTTSTVDTALAHATKSGSRSAPRRRLTIGIVASAIALVGVGVFVGRSTPKSEATAAAGAIAAAMCTSNEACTRDRGAPHICRKGACVSLISDDCDNVVGDHRDPDSIFIGVQSNRTKGLSRTAENAVGLAINEFSKIAIGVPSPNGRRRPVAAIMCDTAKEANHDLHRSSRHLIETVGVPAIITALASEDLTDQALRFTIPSGTLLIVSQSGTAALAQVADRALIWKTQANLSLQSRALSRLVADTERRVRQERGIAAGERVRAAMLVLDIAGYKLSAEEMLPTARLNGKELTANRGHFLRIDYPQSDAKRAKAVPEIAAQLKALDPHIVVILGLKEVTDHVLPELENTLAAPGRTAPNYVLVRQQHARVWDGLLGEGKNESLRQRVVGVTTRGYVENPVFKNYMLRFSAAGGKDEATATDYDAAYALFYAMTATRKAEPLTGADIGKGMEKLIGPGAKITVGPSDIGPALTKLAAGESIDLDGTSGTLAFDPKTGDTEGAVHVWCITRDEKGNPVPTVATGQRYDAAKDVLDGTYQCPAIAP